MAKKVDDLKAAMMYVTSLGYNKIALFGHSFNNHLSIVEELAGKWLLKHFPLSSL
nr:hypothetical protein [Brevibacillus laterosporus]